MTKGQGGGREPGAGRPAQALGGAGMGAVLAALVWLGSGCSDPRQRPAPPTIVLTLSTTVHPTSPGTLAGSLYLYDATGLDSVRLTVDMSDGRLLGDSIVVPTDPIESTVPFQWRVPGGIPTGTRIRVVAWALNFIAFEAADTVFTAVADSAGNRR